MRLGLVVAVKGTCTKGGEFETEEILFPSLAPQAPPSSLSSDWKWLTHAEKKSEGWVALISGTSVGGVNQNPLAFQLFVDFITGNLGSTSGTSAYH